MALQLTETYTDLPVQPRTPYRTIVGNNPVNRIDPRGLAGMGGCSGMHPAECQFWWDFDQLFRQLFKESATAIADCLSCTAWCAAPDIVWSIFVQDVVVKETLKYLAKKTAKEALTKAIPYYGWASLTWTGIGVVICAYDCT